MNRVVWILVMLWSAMAHAASTDPGGVRNALAILDESVRLRQTDPVRSSALASDAAALLAAALPDGGADLPHAQRTLGNAWMLAGEHGRAVLAYRRAELAEPRDPIIRSSLANARSVAGVEVVTAPAVDDWRSWVLQWRAYMPRAWVFWGGTALWVVGCGLIAARVWSGAGRFTIGAVGLVIVGGVGVGMTAFEHRLEPAGGAVVIRESEGRTGPHAHLYPTALDRAVPAGTEVRVLEARDGWKLCRIGALQAWLPASAVEPIRP